MTGQNVFNLSMAVLQENASAGEYNASTYLDSAPLLINLLLGMLHEADCKIKGKDEVFDEGAIPYVNSLRDPILLHESLVRVCLPLGLASLFISGDQPNLSAILWQRFMHERNNAVMRYRRSKRHETRDVYFT